ncbi:hypothetical protein [Bacillus toyonensis]|uniref:hypothetical protein n=1 Tax=Bacillus toyonensis TaxID=155322 RepID=UPI000BF555D8|nr:hypothetical protein [Bacillus toyonensis]PGF05021.1 hypothetical protein COM61_00880 [Bacillus toyonensis]
METIKNKLLNKETLFTLAVIGVCYKLYSYTAPLPYWERLLVRLCVLLVVTFLYKKFINKGEMKSKVNKYRLKGWKHHILMVIGIVMFGYIAYLKKNQYHIETPKTIEGNVNNFLESGLTVTSMVFAFLFALVCTLPIAYFFIQTMFYLRLVTVWVYNRNKKLLLLTIFIDEIVGLSIVTLMA